MKVKLVSVIVPAYNQDKTIAKDLKRIKGVLSQLRYPTELIVVDDGSSDKTLSEARKVSGVKAIGYEVNKGKGNAVRFGMAQSKGDIIAFIDSGMDLNPNGLSICLEHFEWYNADIIIGSKRHPASKIQYPWQRKILSAGYQILTFILFGLKVRDTQVGLKLFRREVLEKVLPRLLVKRFAFDIEMLAVANYLGFNRIFEAPVEIHLDFGGASVLTSNKFLKNVSAMLIDTLAVFYRLRILNYYTDSNNRRWRFDPELNFRVNLG